MIAEQAFRAIHAAIRKKGQRPIIHSLYDPTAFGNFIIAFKDAGRERSIVCDRLELAVCDDLQGERGCKTVLASIQRVNEAELLRAVGLE
jgi:hypothetical protein